MVKAVKTRAGAGGRGKALRVSSSQQLNMQPIVVREFSFRVM